MAVKNDSFKSTLGFDGKVFTLYKYQIEIQAKLLKKIKHSLPDHLSAHALYCVLSNKKLSLYTDSATWSSQLRFYQQAILQSLLGSHEGIVETFQIKIIPQSVEQETVKKRVKKLPSQKNIDFILEQAKSQRDEGLRNSLLSLGRVFQKKTEERD